VVHSTRLLFPPASIVEQIESASSSNEPLSPCDGAIRSTSCISLLFFYARPSGWNEEVQGEFMPFDRVAAALERLLFFHPYLARGLEFSARDDGTMELAGGKAGTVRGVPIVRASVNDEAGGCGATTIASLPLDEPRFTSTRVLPSSLVLLRALDKSAPLDEFVAHAQHTRFACGGVCVGLHVHHAVVDGDAYFGLMRDWTELYRQTRDVRVDIDGATVVQADCSHGTLSRGPPLLRRDWLTPQSAEEAQRALQGYEEEIYYAPATSVAFGSPAAAAAAVAPAAVASASASAAVAATIAGSTSASPTPSPPPPVVASAAAANAPKPTIARMFRFGPTELGRIKAAAMATLSSTAGGAAAAVGSASAVDGASAVPWVSTFEAVVAHLHRAIYLARNPHLLPRLQSDDDGEKQQQQSRQEANTVKSDDASTAVIPAPTNAATTNSERPTRLIVVVNFRPRLRDVPKELPVARFVGNACLWVQLQTEASQADDALVKQPLGHTAARLHAALESLDTRRVRGALAWLHSLSPRRDQFAFRVDMSATDLAVTAWNKFGMYEHAAFDEGIEPIRVCRSSTASTAGFVILFGTPSSANPHLTASSGANSGKNNAAAGGGGGGAERAIDVCIGLTEECMARLEAGPLLRLYR
jgi:hypothetical protein